MLADRSQPKTVSSSEAKGRFGALLAWVLKSKQEVLIKSYSEVKAVLIPFEDYDDIKRILEIRRRQKLLDELQNLRGQVQSKNKSISSAKAERIVDRFSREIINNTINK